MAEKWSANGVEQPHPTLAAIAQIVDNTWIRKFETAKSIG
jgi:hypothetical protein